MELALAQLRQQANWSLTDKRRGGNKEMIAIQEDQDRDPWSSLTSLYTSKSVTIGDISRYNFISPSLLYDIDVYLRRGL